MSAKIPFCPSQRLECQAFTTHSYVCMFTQLIVGVNIWICVLDYLNKTQDSRPYDLMCSETDFTKANFHPTKGILNSSSYCCCPPDDHLQEACPHFDTEPPTPKNEKHRVGNPEELPLSLQF